MSQRKYRELTSDRDLETRLIHDEHRLGLPLVRVQGRWCLHVLGRYRRIRRLVGIVSVMAIVAAAWAWLAGR